MSKRRQRETEGEPVGKTKRKRRKKKSQARKRTKRRRAAAIDRRAAQSLLQGRRMAMAATITLVGVAMVGMDASFWGGVIVVAGLLGMIATIHLFGRLGYERAQSQ